MPRTAAAVVTFMLLRIGACTAAVAATGVDAETGWMTTVKARREMDAMGSS